MEERQTYSDERRKNPLSDGETEPGDSDGASTFRYVASCHGGDGDIATRTGSDKSCAQPQRA